MAPWFTCCFIMLFYIKRKWLLIRNFVTILSFNSTLMENFSVSMLLIKVSKWWKIVEFSKPSIKMKHSKTFYGTQTTSRLKEIIQKKILMETYRNIQAFIFQVLPEWSSWTSRNGAVQTFFWKKKKKQKCVCWKNFKWVWFLAVLRAYIFYNVEWAGVRKVRLLNENLL